MRGSLWPVNPMWRTLPAFCASMAARMPPLVEDPVRIAVVDHLMKLPEVEVIGTQAAEAVVEAPLRALVVPLAVLRHEERLRAAAVGQRAPHHLFRPAVVVVPAVVEEGQAFVDRGVHDANGLGRVFDRPDVPAAQAENRHSLSRTAERSGWESCCRRGLLAGQHLIGQGGDGGAAGHHLGDELASRSRTGHGSASLGAETSAHTHVASSHPFGGRANGGVELSVYPIGIRADLCNLSPRLPANDIARSTLDSESQTGSVRRDAFAGHRVRAADAAQIAGLRARDDCHARIGNRRQHRCFQRGERNRPATLACTGCRQDRRDRQPAILQPNPPWRLVRKSPGLSPCLPGPLRGHRWLQCRIPGPGANRKRAPARSRHLGDGQLFFVARYSPGSGTHDTNRRSDARANRSGGRTRALNLAAKIRGRSIGRRSKRHGERPALHDRRRRAC